MKHNLSIAWKNTFSTNDFKDILPILDTWWPYTLEEQNDVSNEFFIDITDD